MCMDTLGHFSDGTIGFFMCHNTGGNQVLNLMISLLLILNYSLHISYSEIVFIFDGHSYHGWIISSQYKNPFWLVLVSIVWILGVL